MYVASLSCYADGLEAVLRAQKADACDPLKC